MRIKGFLISLVVMMSMTGWCFSTENSDFLQGRLDAQRHAKGDTEWYCFGCAMGPAAVFLPLFLTFNPPPERFIGRSKEYVQGYTEDYRKNQKAANFKSALKGSALVILTGLLILLKTI